MIRNRAAAAQAAAWREFIVALYESRSQAERYLTVKEIANLCNGALAERTIKQHVATLRQQGRIGCPPRYILKTRERG